MEEIRAQDVKDQAKEDYLNGMKYKDLAGKYGVSLNTIKSWVKRYGWSKEKKGNSRKGAHKNKRGAPLNNKNAVGNNGGAPLGNKNAVGHGAPKGNKNAETHGFFSKYFHEETLEIIQEIETRSPVDILWDNIMIQYTAIIRAQRIMYVKDKEDITKNLRKERITDNSEEREWEFQYAWDKQANFLQAQSRAMAQLTSMIKRYEEMCKSDITTEEQRLRIEKLKVEVNKIKEDTKTTEQVVIVDDI